jgi:hypothetical protein
LTRSSRSSSVLLRLRHGLAAAALALGCTHASESHMPDALAKDRLAKDALPLPSDLAAVVRVDAAALGAELGAELAQKVLRDAVGTEAVSGAPLLARSLTAANVLWFGLPAPGSAEPAPGVLVVRGRFASVGSAADSADADWSVRSGGIRVLELTDAAASAGYARVYALPGDEVWVWASATEVQAVEAALRGHAAGAPLRPPERGAVSLAANPDDLLARARARYPELSERFAGLTRFEGFAEATQGTWRAELTLEFSAATQTVSANDAVARLAGALAQRSCAVGALARGLFVSHFERSLRVQAWLEGPALEAVRDCVLGVACCA